jgi:hypothetical protein
MGSDFAGSCARSPETEIKRSERNRGKVVLRLVRGDNGLGMGIIYA